MQEGDGSNAAVFYCQSSSQQGGFHMHYQLRKGLSFPRTGAIFLCDTQAGYPHKPREVTVRGVLEKAAEEVGITTLQVTSIRFSLGAAIIDVAANERNLILNMLTLANQEFARWQQQNETYEALAPA